MPHVASNLSRLKPLSRPSIAGHLKRLSADDCHMRFGSVKTPEQIDDYVARLNFNRDIVEGAFDGPLLIAMGVVSVFDSKGYPAGELALTVDATHRRQHLGGRIVERVLEQAQARGLTQVYVHYLRRNLTMARLVAARAMSVEPDGDEVTAILAPVSRESQHPIRRVVTHDGLEVYECDVGLGGTPRGHVLFVHGAGGDAWQFRQQLMPALAQRGIESAAISLRSHGGSAAGRDGTIDEMDEDVSRFVQSHGKPHSVLVGHSLGGFLVQKHLLRDTDRRAILLNSVPPRALSGQDLDQAAEGLECHTARGVLRTAMSNVQGLDLTPVKSPLLWIAGERDRVIPKAWVRDSVRRAHASAMNDQYVELPGGHSPMLGRSCGLLSDQVERAIGMRG